MNGLELTALRRLLMLSRAEAAALVGNVTERSWDRWENSESPVPLDVSRVMRTLLSLRTDYKTIMASQYESGERNFFGFPCFQDWLAQGREDSRLGWRAWQSALADLYASKPDVQLVAKLA